MQLDHHLAQVHQQLSAAAALGDERTQEIAAALATAATPAVRLAVLNALSEAADEVTAALLDSPGAPAVTVRLDGDEVHVAVQTGAADTGGTEPRRDDGDTSARISLRLSEALKADVDDAAERAGVSVNTWLVRAASAALTPGPFGPSGPGHGSGRHGSHNITNHRVTGWING
ncbi:MAG: putative transcriptional regulator, CopG family [Jatrophihabitans sp.]|nr:putative transcriptional regulator, CopG family [Jatrophihabitans sp.]